MSIPAALQNATRAYTDLSALQALKRPSLDKATRLEAVAHQFEALMTAQMLKSMRQASRVLSEGNPFTSSTTEFYEDMFDQQLAVSLSGQRGLGLAQVLIRQLGEPVRAGSERTLEDYRRQPVASPLSRDEQQVLERTEALIQGTSPEDQTDNQSTTDGDVTVTSVDTAANNSRYPFSGPEDFVRRLAPSAKRVADKLGVDYRVLLAQAALETGWGQHVIRDDAGRLSHNLFGIKADQRWTGDTAWTTTTEYVNGQPIRTRAPFRAYPDWEQSFSDYLNFLTRQPRYRLALDHAQDPKAYTEALQSAGYATDPAYSQKILGILRRMPGGIADGGDS